VNTPPSDFTAELQQLAERTARDLADRQGARAVTRELGRALPLLLLVPGVWILATLVQAAGSGRGPTLLDADGAWHFDLGAVIAIALLAGVPLAVWLALAVRSARRARLAPERALAVLDRHAKLADRLTTAHEFLGLTGRSAFEQAAIEDAHAAVAAARTTVLPHVEIGWRRDRAALGVVGGALLACVLAAHLRLADAGDAERGAPSAEGDVELVGSLDERAREPGTGEREAEPDAVPPREARERKPQPAARSEARATDVPEQVKQSQGETREGQSSDAQASSGAGQAKGAPSNQEQKSAGESKTTEPPKKQKEVEARNDEEQPKKQAEEDSGSTAGKGSGRGSNRNSVATPWSSKDQVDTPDDQEVQDDEDFEDDAEEQKARGGMQPNLRDRRPPVSRDLSIGFGNRPNPDANGRGGPSDQKKSRGTASLVLGVPVPDRVKGQPNKGKTKITQERVEPRAETADVVAAGVRPPSSLPLGHVPAPHSSPFVQDAVRSYFDALRARPTP